MKYNGITGLRNICEYFEYDYEYIKQKLATGSNLEDIIKEIKQEKIRLKRKQYFNDYYFKKLKQKRLQNKKQVIKL
jgi:hypothetical protein